MGTGRPKHDTGSKIAQRHGTARVDADQIAAHPVVGCTAPVEKDPGRGVVPVNAMPAIDHVAFTGQRSADVVSRRAILETDSHTVADRNRPTDVRTDVVADYTRTTAFHDNSAAVPGYDVAQPGRGAPDKARIHVDADSGVSIRNGRRPGDIRPDEVALDNEVRVSIVSGSIGTNAVPQISRDQVPRAAESAVDIGAFAADLGIEGSVNHDAGISIGNGRGTLGVCPDEIALDRRLGTRATRPYHDSGRPAPVDAMTISGNQVAFAGRVSADPRVAARRGPKQHDDAALRIPQRQCSRDIGADVIALERVSGGRGPAGIVKRDARTLAKAALNNKLPNYDITQLAVCDNSTHREMHLGEYSSGIIVRP
ncbi:MAG: hypothetical protein FJ297_08985 [Planctomycetes bacterium]|nr:hypothetical protein [Planctomycetota bacterium]